MTPSSIIAELDRSLLETGEDIRLQRLILGPSGTQIPIAVDCRASVRGVAVTPASMPGGAAQLFSDVVISPTEITRQAWPGAATSAAAGRADRRIPLREDRVIIKGRPHTVQYAHGKYVGGELVRIEMRVLG